MAAVPKDTSDGIRKSTRYASVSPGQPILLVAGTSLPFTTTSTGEFTTCRGLAEKVCAPGGVRSGPTGPSPVARTMSVSPGCAGLAGVTREKSLWKTAGPFVVI